jgi:hypothetical protein
MLLQQWPIRLLFQASLGLLREPGLAVVVGDAVVVEEVVAEVAWDRPRH